MYRDTHLCTTRSCICVCIRRGWGCKDSAAMALRTGWTRRQLNTSGVQRLLTSACARRRSVSVCLCVCVCLCVSVYQRVCACLYWLKCACMQYMCRTLCKSLRAGHGHHRISHGPSTTCQMSPVLLLTLWWRTPCFLVRFERGLDLMHAHECVRVCVHVCGYMHV